LFIASRIPGIVPGGDGLQHFELADCLRELQPAAHLHGMLSKDIRRVWLSAQVSAEQHWSVARLASILRCCAADRTLCDHVALQSSQKLPMILS
jgi:hypothetical protein